MTPASQWCEMLSLFFPFKQQPVKSPQLNKGVSAQCTRVLGRSTWSVSKHGWTRTNRGEPETQWRWRLQSQLTSHSSWGGGADSKSLPATVQPQPQANGSLVTETPMAPSACSSKAYEPDKARHGRGACTTQLPITFPFPCASGAHNPKDPELGGRAHCLVPQPVTPVTPAATRHHWSILEGGAAVIMRALGHPFDRGPERWKVPLLKFNQRQRR